MQATVFTKRTNILKKDLPVYLFLSHFHIDHIEGLHTLAKFKFKSLEIIGQLAKATIKEISCSQIFYPCPQTALPLQSNGH